LEIPCEEIPFLREVTVVGVLVGLVFIVVGLCAVVCGWCVWFGKVAWSEKSLSLVTGVAVGIEPTTFGTGAQSDPKASGSG